VPRFGDGLAVDADLVRAAEAAAVAARTPLGGLNPDLACVFVCGDDPEQIAEALARASSVLRARTVIGCSASGVIGGSQGVEATSSVSVWAAVLPDVRIRAFHLEVIRTPQGMAVLGLPEGEDTDEVAVVLADPFSFPTDGFVEQPCDSPDQTGLALPALAEQHEVVAGQQRALNLRYHGLVEPDDAGETRFASTESRKQVVANFGLDRFELVARCA
jgi:small ligand-binding sensory domain FIST